jgi:AhpD family alkylhydroperoxidase
MVVVKRITVSAMEDKTKLLIAVGASLTANCQACLKTAITHAQGAGVSRKEISEAIAIGRVVRRGAFGKMDKLSSKLTGYTENTGSDECPFGSTEEDIKEWVEQDDKCDCT